MLTYANLMKWQAIIAPIIVSFLVGSGCLSMGCSVINTGPEMSKATIEGTLATGKLVLQSYAPDKTSVNAHGDISDPEFVGWTFAGSGVFVETHLKLIGANLGFGIESTGGAVEVDQETRAKILAIMGNAAMNEEERKNAIQAAVLEWLAKGFAAQQKPPATQPSTPTTSITETSNTGSITSVETTTTTPRPESATITTEPTPTPAP